MKTYTLPSTFGRFLAWIKFGALLGGFLYIWLEELGGQKLADGADAAMVVGNGSMPMWFWVSFVVLAAVNFLTFWHYYNQPELQERMYQISLVIDLFSVLILFFWHPVTFMLLLIGMAMVASFYSFAMPRGTGFVVWLLATLVYSFAVLYDWKLSPAGDVTWQHATALLVVGLAIITTVCLLVKSIKHGVDKIYIATSEITYDLTSQAVEASIAHEDLLERSQEVQTLIQVIQNIYSELEWEELFRNIIQAFRNRFRFDKFTLYLFNEESQMLELRVESGAEKAGGPAKAVTPGTGMVGWAYVNGKGVLVQDTRNDPRFKEFTDRSRRIRSLACQPLIFRGQTIGVLCLDSEKVASFDEKAFSFLQSIAPLLSIAVGNSMSYHEMKEETFTDNLTGLKNHRGFVETFLPLLNDCYVDEFSLAVMIMDLDNFKKVNDTYGHQVGNLVLIELAQILSTFFRGSDLVARYGGEEFVVVLNGTPSEIAPRIAEQLRRKIETHQFPISLSKDTFKQLTISIGLAASSDVNLQPEIVSGSRGRGERDKYVRNLEELKQLLIENADQALYVAKRNGKNQVRLSFHYPPTHPVSEEDLVSREAKLLDGDSAAEGQESTRIVHGDDGDFEVTHHHPPSSGRSD
ncbi:GGDEF domain-containing protein [bacterium]|nr:GGDEF domain-containing protein [bacterium]